MKVEYISEFGVPLASEWICLDHKGFAREKAKQWIKKRINPKALDIPQTVAEALNQCHDLARPSRIEVDESGDFDRVTRYDFKNHKDVELLAPPKELISEEDLQKRLEAIKDDLPDLPKVNLDFDDDWLDDDLPC